MSVLNDKDKNKILNDLIEKSNEYEGNKHLNI